MLIVEDGTVVAGANTYLSLVDARAMAIVEGISLSDDDTTAEAQLVQGYRYLTDNYGSKLSGERVSASQTSMVPRRYMYFKEGRTSLLIASDIIPDDFKQAQLVTASVVNSGADINAYESGGDLLSFAVPGAYSETRSGSDNSVAIKIPSVTKMLDAYFSNEGGLVRSDYW